MIMESAARNGIDPALIVAIMRQESGFKPNALSHKGARGLMQLIPATARRFGVANIWDPAQNIEGGARYLRFLLDTFNGDVKLALAGYNAGENAVIGAGYRIPRYRETQAYVRNISARYGSDTHRGARGTRKVDPQAPQAMLIDAGSSSRFSNNY
jgi:soluble lytic murein transglycosylase-like protein